MAKYMVYGNGKIGKIFNFNSLILAKMKAKAISKKREHNFMGTLGAYIYKPIKTKYGIIKKLIGTKSIKTYYKGR
jgi:hypothetical protein